jgi:hypothetical protein
VSVPEPVVSIDQCAEAAFGNRNYFLNRPPGIGSNRRSVLDLPPTTGVSREGTNPLIRG